MRASCATSSATGNTPPLTSTSRKILKYVAVIAIDVTPHDDAHALHSYDSALASRSARVLALRLGVVASAAFL